MRSLSRLRPRAMASLGMLAALAAAGCEIATDPASHPLGAAILDEEGVEVARYLHGPQRGSGELVVGVGQTGTFQVRLIDGNGTLFRVDGVQHTIRQVTVLRPQFATAQLQEPDRIMVTGVRLTPLGDDTELVFDVYHGTHREFEVSEIFVAVRQ